MASAHDWLSDMLDAIGRLRVHVAPHDQGSFLGDITAQDAVVRSLEIVGEAAKHLDDDFRTKNAHVPWSKMARLRDFLSHHYWRVDYLVIWKVAVNDILPLYPELERLHRESGTLDADAN